MNQPARTPAHRDPHASLPLRRRPRPVVVSQRRVPYVEHHPDRVAWALGWLVTVLGAAIVGMLAVGVW